MGAVGAEDAVGAVCVRAGPLGYGGPWGGDRLVGGLQVEMSI